MQERTIKYHLEDLSGHSFLVTGGAGFIGSNLVEYLLRHGAARVVVLDDLSTGKAENMDRFTHNDRFHFIEGDITDAEACQMACRNVDIIFHEAALGSVPRSIKDPLATNAANINGFLNLLVAAKDKGVRRFIYAASSSVYGDSKILPKTEENIGRPLSPYAVTKLVNELYAEVFHKVYGMECIGLRYFNVFGPWQNPDGPYAAVIPNFIQAILRGEQAVIHGDGCQTRDFTYIDNVIEANIKAAFAKEQAATGQVYNIAVGDQITVKEVYYALRNLAGSNLEPHFTEGRKGDIRDSLADISKARQFLGYDPQVKVAQGLEHTFKWFKSKYLNK